MDVEMIVSGSTMGKMILQPGLGVGSPSSWLKTLAKAGGVKPEGGKVKLGQHGEWC